MSLRRRSAPATERLPLEEGLAHLRSHRWDHAIVALRLALQREPGRLSAVRALATAHLLSGGEDQARCALEAYTQQHPACDEAWRLAAQLEWRLDYRARAIELLRAALRKLPASRVLHHQLAVFLAARGEMAGAAEHLKRATPEPATDRPASELGAPADQDWLDQVALEPALLLAVVGPYLSSDDAAEIPEKSRRMLQAIAERLASLLDSQPGHPDRRVLLARLQARLGLMDAALRSLDQALALNPHLIEAHRQRARVLAQAGQVEQAVQILKQLLKRGLNWPDIHYEIASFEQRRGHAADARGHLYSAIRLNPKFERARELLEKCAA